MADAVYHDAARVFPLPERLDKAVEEAAELISAVQHWRGNRITDVDLADEIADTEIMCQHLRLVVGDGLVEVRRGIKQRRLRRMVEDAVARLDRPDWVAPR